MSECETCSKRGNECTAFYCDHGEMYEPWHCCETCGKINFCRSHPKFNREQGQECDMWSPSPTSPSTALSRQEGGEHYKGWKIEPVEFLIANSEKIPAAEGAIIKYACRHKAKNGVEDLKKIIHYCQLIAELHYGVKI